jgi:hypothetical protein
MTAVEFVVMRVFAHAAPATSPLAGVTKAAVLLRLRGVAMFGRPLF